MKRFYWYGSTASGQRGRGTLKADDRHAARQFLREQQIVPYLLFAIPVQQAAIKSIEITLFIRQLATLTASGLTLPRALEGIIRGLPNSPLHQLASDILLELEQGNSFSRTLERRPRLFDPFLIHLIQAGEHAGRISQLLTRAAEYRERNHALSQQATKALAYPLTVLLFTLLITSFLLLKIVPQFESLFNNLGGELPGLTQAVLTAAQFLDNHFYLLLLTLITLSASATLLYRGVHSFRLRVDRTLLSLPLVGPTLIEIMVSRLTRTLATLQESGIRIHTALTVSAEMSKSPLFESIIQTIHQSIHEGKTFSQALLEQPLIPPIAVQMVQAGEESSALPHMLSQLANYYEREVEHRIHQLTTLLEPLLILIIGGLIGILAVALYQPIFQIGHQL